MNEIFQHLSASSLLADVGAGIAGGLGFGTVLLFALVVYAVTVYPIYVIGQKANYANPAFAFIPILNILVLLDVAGLEVWYIVLFFVPCVNGIVGLYLWYKVAEAMDKPGWVGLLMIIPCVGLAVPYYIAFG